jgi:hypothetical protein
MDKALMQKMFIKLFSTRQIAHVEHLKTDMFSAHIALNELYDELLDLTDELIETYQGQFGLIEPIDKLFLEYVDIIEYLESFASEVARISEKMPEGCGHLGNIMQEISSLIYKTIYKLKFLK